MSRLLWRVFSLTVVVVTVALAGSAAAAARADDPDLDSDGNLSVVITDGSTSTPAPSTTPTAPVPNGGGLGPGASSGGAGGASGAGGGAGSGAGSGTGPSSSGSISLGGILTMGGINSAPRISVNPLAGDVRLWFTVYNGSKSTIDATATFWMDSWPFGVAVDRTSEVAIRELRPGTARVVTAELHGAGQWTLLNTHVTLTPPATVDGTALAPATRDALVFVFPWLLLAAAILVLLGILVVHLVRSTAVLPPRLAEVS